MLGTEEAWSSRNVRISDQHIGRCTFVSRCAFVGDEGTNRRIGHGAANGTAGVHAVAGGGVFVDDFVMHGAHRGYPIHKGGELAEVLTNLDTWHRRIDSVIVGTGSFLRRIAFTFGIEGVDLPHATAKPNGDDMFGFPGDERVLVSCGERCG